MKNDFQSLVPFLVGTIRMRSTGQSATDIRCPCPTFILKRTLLCSGEKRNKDLCKCNRFYNIIAPHLLRYCYYNKNLSCIWIYLIMHIRRGWMCNDYSNSQGKKVTIRLMIRPNIKFYKIWGLVAVIIGTVYNSLFPKTIDALLFVLSASTITLSLS